MENLKINLALLCNGSKESYQLYLHYLVNVVVSYLLLKGCTVLVPGNADTKQMHVILCLDQVWISLYSCFWTYDFNIEELEYYLKVFLNQEVAPKYALDIAMMKKLGDLYPRHLVNNPYLHMWLTYLREDILDAFLEGVDPIKKVYIADLNQRVLVLDSWLQLQPLEFSNEMQKELFTLAVANLEKQPIASHYLFCYFAHEYNYFKLTKEQYLRLLRYFISRGFFWKSNSVYIDILKGDVISGDLGGLPYMDFHVVFPQVFAEFNVDTWDFVQDFNLVGPKLLLLILKTYAANLIFKYFNYLQTNTKFFQSFEIFNNLSYDHAQIENIVKNLSGELFFKILEQLLIALRSFNSLYRYLVSSGILKK